MSFSLWKENICSLGISFGAHMAWEHKGVYKKRTKYINIFHKLSSYNSCLNIPRGLNKIEQKNKHFSKVSSIYIPSQYMII